MNPVRVIHQNLRVVASASLGIGLPATLLILGACNLTNGGNPDAPPGPGCQNTATSGCSVETLNPPDQLLGERLFKDTRFGHFFATTYDGDVNAPLAVGESVVSAIVTDGKPATLPGPMAGQAVNCLQCHLVQQELTVPGGGMRTYADFAQRSPTPLRPEDTVHGDFTPRNAASMVNDVFHGNVDTILHWDAQFGSMSDLVTATLTGRNFGWLPGEYNQAIHQVAVVIRGDDGTSDLARQFSDSLPYATVFACADPHIPAAYKLPQQYCLDVASASDADIEADVANLISSYVNSLMFSQDANGEFNGSPYDQFLIANNLPRQPAAGQTPFQYAAALRSALQGLSNPTFVNQGTFKFHHGAPFVFGAQELRGLMTFLARPAGPVITPAEVAQGGIGNCAACHAPPQFTDFLMHNTGVSQAEYDAVHGQGAFAQLQIPNLAQRDADPDAYLPVTAQHPDATEVFRSAPVAGDPQKADLGVWNIFANPDFTNRYASLRNFLCALSTQQFGNCNLSDDQLLSLSVAVFKTRVVRDLGDSDPYMHNGQFPNLTAAVQFYQNSGVLARAGQLRNGDRQMQNIALNGGDIADLVAFLNALNEDYSN